MGVKDSKDVPVQDQQEGVDEDEWVYYNNYEWVEYNGWSIMGIMGGETVSEGEGV